MMRWKSLTRFTLWAGCASSSRLHTSQSAVARLESAEVDAKLTTVERYAAALGKKFDWILVDA
jgi:predicted transcriptional regulator